MRVGFDDKLEDAIVEGPNRSSAPGKLYRRHGRSVAPLASGERYAGIFRKSKLPVAGMHSRRAWPAEI